MSDFLTRLAERTLGVGSFVAPSLPSAFATPAASPLIEEGSDDVAPAAPAAAPGPTATGDTAPQRAGERTPASDPRPPSGRPRPVESGAVDVGPEAQPSAHAASVRGPARRPETAPRLVSQTHTAEEGAAGRVEAPVSSTSPTIADQTAARDRDVSDSMAGRPDGIARAIPERRVPQSGRDRSPRGTLQPLVPRSRLAPEDEVAALDLAHAVVPPEPAPTVRITIGRVEVRGVPPPQPGTAQRRQREAEPPRLSLSEYLKRGGAR